MNYRNIVALMIKMSMKIKWLKYCVRQIDVTNIGKQHSLISTINKEPSKEELSDMNDI